MDKDSLSPAEFEGTLIGCFKCFEDVPGLAFEDGELAGIHFLLEVVVFVKEGTEEFGSFLPPLLRCEERDEVVAGALREGLSNKRYRKEEPAATIALL